MNDNQGASPLESDAAMAEYGHVFATFVTETKSFRRPYIRLVLQPSEQYLDYAIGPVIIETHTRQLFVLTTRTLRVFSMETCQEMKVIIHIQCI